MNKVIEARGLRKRYGKTEAVKGVDLSIEAGKIVGLIGPNGAGKTSVLKAMLGLTDFEGELSVLGRNPHTERHALMQDVCFIADVAVLPRWIRVREAIEYVEGVHARFSRAKCEAFLAKTKLKPEMRVREMSKGMIVQLHLALVMAIDAKLLVLDNFPESLRKILPNAPDGRIAIYACLTPKLLEYEIEHILTDVLFIKDGVISLSATMDELGSRFTEVMVPADKRQAALAFKPLDERQVFGKSILLYDGVSRDQLDALGETRTPGLADIFVATMKGTYQ